MTRQLVVDTNVIDDTSDCYVIAEIGNNHQGSMEKAKALIAAAKDCGADAVKLQKRDNRSLYTKAMFNKPYENENSFGATYGTHREFLEFGMDEYLELKRYCQELDITFFATAFDVPSANFLAELDMPAYKIASGDLKSMPLIKHVAQFGKPLFISTGGASLEEIERVYDAIAPINNQLCLLQCTASYPTQPEDMNLRVIDTFRERFPDLVIGLSDHYNGIVMTAVAYAMGARVIEKHFTLNHTWKGTDHALSLEPIGMSKMVRDLRRLRMAMGDGVKQPLAVEAAAIKKMGKTLVAARQLDVGHILTEKDIAMKSPGGQGLPPYEIEALLGRELKQPLNPDDPILLEHIA